MQIDSIASVISQELARRFQSHAEDFRVVGGDSLLGLALLVLDRVHQQSTAQPILIVLPEESAVDQFLASLSFLDTQIQPRRLRMLDVSFYSGLYPKESLSAERIRWLAEAQNARAGQIFISSVHALGQKTLPFQLLAQCRLQLSVKESLPEDLTEKLQNWGYRQAPFVEDIGTFAVRGGIIDVFSPAHDRPMRIELFADQIESLRFFDPLSQTSVADSLRAVILPAREGLIDDTSRARILSALAPELDVLPENFRSLQTSLQQNQSVPEMDLLVPLMFPKSTLPLEHFSSALDVFVFDSLGCAQNADSYLQELKSEHTALGLKSLGADVFFQNFEALQFPEGSKRALFDRVEISAQTEDDGQGLGALEYSTTSTLDLQKLCVGLAREPKALVRLLKDKLGNWRELGYRIFLSTPSETTLRRMELLLSEADFQIIRPGDSALAWPDWISEQDTAPMRLHLLQRDAPESVRLVGEKIVFLRDVDIFGHKHQSKKLKDTGTLTERTNAMSFGDLAPGEFIVHQIHGVGVFDGLKTMNIHGVAGEYIQIQYKDADKLYLPVYRIAQIKKFSGPQAPGYIDKLGGQGWLKTKTKVRNALRDLAGELLRIYAARAHVERPAFSAPDTDYFAFENGFAFDETPDQLRAIRDVIDDLQKPKPMDRLVCGDVGFGKTEVALRAAFKVVEDRKQVAVVAPTTILTFQHAETFRKRFKDWPIQIRALNRFVSAADIKKTVAEIKSGEADIVIGTHRLFSKDIAFKDLGLLIVDEEQKFGVKHKETLRRLRVSVDTLAMSATPIPRTLNLSLVGVRDLSLINTPPVDRLPTRTFVCRYDHGVIKKAALAEIERGGQIFFLHNRIQSIYGLAEDLRTLLPGVRMAVAHGQMKEHELEKTMLQFLNHELDILICTAIIESGIDIPNANLMFIDNAHQLGLSQLYQLRGRVGRSKRRAYCYLLLPKNIKVDKVAQERLRVIQEHTALGSGIQIAQHDLELRGSGDILGEDQSGHINAVGYETYIELLEEAVRNAKGESTIDELEPEINVRISALIPDAYIPDVRMRLAYYKMLTDIEGPEDLDRIEGELRDQFGKPPEQVINLMGLMLIRKLCRNLGVRDVSSGTKTISLAFTDRTPLSVDNVIKLTARENKKYALTPDQRLNVRMNEISWPRILEELEFLKSLCH